MDQPTKPLCKNCGSPWHYKYKCPLIPRKPISKRGKQTIKYEKWRDTVAKPYLDATFGHICVVPGCYETEYLDVDHIDERGSHSEKKYDLNNVRYLCRPHHRLVTDGKLKL